MTNICNNELVTKSLIVKEYLFNAMALYDIDNKQPTSRFLNQ